MNEFDVVGIGFGPANIALGAALEETTAPHARVLTAMFLEKQPRVIWHGGMLLPDARIQITIHKDLALPRDPRSRFTFLNFLHQRGRLHDFLSLGDFLPSRAEYNEYLRWAADELSSRVSYGREVVDLAVDPAMDRLRVVSRTEDGKRETWLARNVVLAPGGTPVLPAGVVAGPRVIHASTYVHAIASLALPEGRPPRFVVVGAGQSAAEIFDDLLSRFPDADVTGTFRGLSYRVLEEHASINQAFLPSWKTRLEGMSRDARGKLRAMWDSGNYRVVNEWLIQRIHHRLYDERVTGRDRARFVPLHELTGIDEGDARTQTTARFRNVVDGSALAIDADMVILATGYAYDTNHDLLDRLGGALLRDASGDIEVDGTYRVRLHPEVRARLFLSGRTEDLHGPGEPLLTTSALRAKSLVDSMIALDASARAHLPARAG